MSKKLVFAAALASAALFSGCESAQTTQKISDNLQLLQNKTWIATQIGATEINTPPSSHSVASLRFDEATHHVSGSDSCNRLAGAYTASQDRIQFSQLVTTRMACLDNNNTDALFNEALSKVSHYQAFGKTLKLLDNHGNLLIQFESAVQPR
jgi:heat shock protein HslJ